MKKLLSILLIFSLVFGAPMANAFVFIPGVAALAEFMGASGTLAASIDASAALHLAVLAIGFNTPNSTSPAAADMPLTVRLNPTTPLAVPAGWTAGTGGAQPVPPSSATQTPGSTTYYYGFGITHNYGVNYMISTGGTLNQVLQSACTNIGTGTAFSSFTQKCTMSSAQCTSIGYTGCSDGIQITNGTATQVIAASCPAGYTVSGSNCNLSDATLVPKPADGKCTLIGNGSAPVPDSRDPDCNGIAAAFTGNSTTTLADGTKVTHGSDGTMNISRPDGTWATLNTNTNLETTVVEHYPNSSTGMTTNYQTDLSAPDPSTGVVTVRGSANGTSQGVGSAAGNSSTGSSPSSVTFDKTGLATSAGQDVTNNKLTGIANQLDVTGAPTDLPSAAASASATATTDMAAAKSSLIGIAAGADPVSLDGNFFQSPFPNSTGCTPWVLTWSDALTGSHTLTLDLCPHQEVIQRVGAWVFYVLTAGTIFSMFITT